MAVILNNCLTYNSEKMKKQKFFSILLLVVMLLPLMVSCSKDDDKDDGSIDVSVNAEQMYGKWVVTGQTWTDEDGTEPDMHKVGQYIIFNQDGTGTISNYRLFEDEIRGGFTWSITGNRLKITDSTDDTSYFTITSISSKTLQLTWRDDENIEVTNFSKG